MKYVLVGDFHGADLSNLERVLQTLNPDMLIGMSDFDTVKTILQWMEISKQFNTKNVPGNHDVAILKNTPIISGTLVEQMENDSEQNDIVKYINKLHNKLMDNKEAREYINKLVNSAEKIEIFLDEERFGDTYKTIIMHGALAGDTSSGGPESSPNLWARLKREDDYRRNFHAMNLEGYTIMLRAHDHAPICAYKEPQKSIIRSGPGTFKLFSDRMYVINPGAFYNGFIAVIDTRATKRGFLLRKSESMPVLKYARITTLPQ